MSSFSFLILIFFFLQVVVRQTKSGKEMRHDLMVMENLTFGRNITRQYDLKGALHARFNSISDGSGDVLLDQNFVNDMTSSPLYVSTTAKQKLQRAVWNDTTFLNVSFNIFCALVHFPETCFSQACTYNSWSILSSCEIPLLTEDRIILILSYLEVLSTSYDNFNSFLSSIPCFFFGIVYSSNLL